MRLSFVLLAVILGFALAPSLTLAQTGLAPETRDSDAIPEPPHGAGLGSDFNDHTGITSEDYNHSMSGINMSTPNPGGAATRHSYSPGNASPRYGSSSNPGLNPGYGGTINPNGSN